MIIRPFEAEDHDIFVQLCEEFYNSEATKRKFNKEMTELTFSYLMSKHENLWGYLMLDKESNTPFGYVLITSYWCNEEGGNVLIFDELYIAPSVRNKGYGKLFMQWIEEEFKGKAVEISLEVITTNTRAKELYSKLGYKEDGYEVLSKRL